MTGRRIGRWSFAVGTASALVAGRREAACRGDKDRRVHGTPPCDLAVDSPIAERLGRTRRRGRAEARPVSGVPSMLPCSIATDLTKTASRPRDTSMRSCGGLSNRGASWAHKKKGPRRSAARECADLVRGCVAYQPSLSPTPKNRSSMPSRPVLRMRFRIMNVPEVTLRLFGRSK